jgi:LysM repeat protein
MIRRFFISIISLLCLGTGALAVAQPENCLALVESAVSSFAAVCQGLQSGTICSPQSPEAQQSITQLDRIESTGPGSMSVVQWENALLLLSGDASLERQDDDRSWHFMGNVDEGDCDQRQGTLTLLVPEDTSLTMTLNGVNVALESTYIVLQYQSPNSLSLTIMRGELQLDDETAVQAGKTIVAVTDNNGSIVFWSAPRSVNEHERQVVDAGARIMNALLNTTIAYDAMCAATKHIVQQGENLFRIAINYNTTLDEVMAFNHLMESTIYPGQEIAIPCVDESVEAPTVTCDTNTTHTVKEGDNLFRIALNYHSSVDAIKAANGLTSNTIVVGDQLIVPCGTQPVNTSAASPAPQPFSIRSQRDVCYSIASAFPSGQFPGQLVNSIRALCS